MRQLALLLISTAAFALPASAANVNPRVFVLSQSDVPAHYEFDKDNSTILPSELAAGWAGGRPVVARAGYLNGYVSSYLNVDGPRWHHIASAAFVFRQAKGARLYLAWLDKHTREQTGEYDAGKRSTVDLGDAGWMYVARSRDTGTRVAWRSERVVALVNCEWMSAHRALALAMARKQQRRIADALR